MDISKSSVVELKSIAFDFLVQLEQLQKNLQIVNAELTKRAQEQKVADETPLPEKTAKK